MASQTELHLSVEDNSIEAADDSKCEQDSTNTGGNSLDNDKDKAIGCFRTVLIVVLGLAGASLCLGTYFFVNNETAKDHRLSFTLFANAIEDTLGYHLDDIEDGVRNLADTITESADGNYAFPFVVVSKFEVHGEFARERSKMETIMYAPLVSSTRKTDWETFSVRHQDWIQDSRRTFLDRAKGTTGAVYLPGNISPYIYRRRDNIFAEESDSDPLVPIWYLSPPPFNPAVVNFDIFSQPEYRGLLQSVVSARRSGFSNFVNVEPLARLQLSDADHLAYHERYTNVTNVGDVGYSQPHSLYARPVFATSQDEAVVGVLVGTVAWDSYLANLLPSGIDGVYAVLVSSCSGGENSTSYTYMLDGTVPKYIGVGDLHDHSYENQVRSIAFFSSSAINEGVIIGVCDYRVDLYPSEAFEDHFKSTVAIVAASTVGATFFIVVSIFLMYDKLLNARNERVAAAAKRSNDVVDSLFPANVRGRLMTTDDAQGESVDDVDNSMMRPKMIADLYPSVTIMFADISGFTAWSSEREPAAVFFFLETLFGAFDVIAKKRRVYKVETIGDCYVAVCGLPTERKNHAVVMARFAHECMLKAQEITKNLEGTLGPGTGELDMRIGLNSGPTTAGVLRGDRARFQLFGDTMNVASRMETTGVKGKIQVSVATAKLLMDMGRNGWLVKRQDAVFAKGKGTVETFFLVLRCGDSFSSTSDEQFKDN